MAIHTGDLSALSGDVAYQLGNAVLGRLRTPIINYTQSWGGNRLGRGLVRPGRSNFPYTAELADSLIKVFDEYEPHYTEMADALFARPGVQARFEKTGILEKEDIPAEIIYPLVIETIQKAMNNNPFEVQTGPAKRNDSIIMEKHKTMLDEDEREIYEVLSNMIIKKQNSLKQNK